MRIRRGFSMKPHGASSIGNGDSNLPGSNYILIMLPGCAHALEHCRSGVVPTVAQYLCSISPSTHGCSSSQLPMDNLSLVPTGGKPHLAMTTGALSMIGGTIGYIKTKSIPSVRLLPSGKSQSPL